MNAIFLLTRIRRDAAFRSLPLWVLITAINANVLVSLLVFRVARGSGTAPSTSALILSVWLPLSLYLLFGKVRNRCHRLDLALPIPARELWLSHLAAATVAGSLVLAALVGVLALNRRLLVRLPDREALGFGLGSVVLPVAAGLLLAVVLIHRFDPGSWKPAGGLRYWTLLVAGLAGILLLLVGLSSRPLVAAGLCLALALILGVGAYRSLPPALALFPQAPGRARKAAAPEIDPAAAGDRKPISGLKVLRLLFVILHNAPPWRQAMPWVLNGFIVLFGFLLSRSVGLWLDSEEIRLLNLPMGSYMLFTGAGLLTYHLYRLDPLPVPRKTLFRLLTLPSLVAFCLGFAGGQILAARNGRLVDYRVDGRYRWVEIDPGFMGMTRSGEAPVLTSPWGESHPAWRRPLIKGGGTWLYHPYASSEETSARFEALMTSRAIEAIYGELIPAAEIQERYFQVEADRVQGLKEGGLTLLADYPHLEPPRRGPDTPVFLALVLVPWLLLLSLFARSFRATAGRHRIRRVYWAGLGLLLGLLLAQVAMMLAGWYSPVAAYGLLEILVRRLGADPVGRVAAWAVGLALIGLCYGLAQRQFLRSEVPTSPVRCALVDWGKSEQ